MASIKKRPDGVWRARYRDDAGREHARHFDRKVDGQRWLDEITASQVTGTYVDPQAGLVTFKDYAEKWRVIQTHRESTQLITESDLRLHVYPIIGDLPLNKILPSTLQALVTGMDLSPVAVRSAMRPVKAVFRAAILDRKIPADPTLALTYPALVDGEMFIPTRTMAFLVREKLPEPFKILVDLGIGSGMRAAEIGGLEIDHVDFLRRELHVRQQRVRPGSGEAYLCAPKTRSSRRTIPLASITLDALAQHVEHHAGTVQVLDRNDPRKPQHRPAHMLFPWPIKAPERMAAPLEVRKIWNTAVQAANKELTAQKLPAFPGGRESGLHCLRHFYASMLITAGESVTVVQRRLGHASATTTLNTYSHLWPDSDSRTRDIVTAILADSTQDHADSPRTERGPHAL